MIFQNTFKIMCDWFFIIFCLMLHNSIYVAFFDTSDHYVYLTGMKQIKICTSLKCWRAKSQRITQFMLAEFFITWSVFSVLWIKPQRIFLQFSLCKNECQGAIQHNNNAHNEMFTQIFLPWNFISQIQKHLRNLTV